MIWKASCLIRRANEVLFQVVEEMCEAYDKGIPRRWSAEVWHDQCQGFMDSFLNERNTFVLPHQDILLEALGRSVIEEQEASA